MAPARRPRRNTLRRSVEQAIRQRLAPEPAVPGQPAQPAIGDLFPVELDAAIDRALLELGQRPPVTGRPA